MRPVFIERQFNALPIITVPILSIVALKQALAKRDKYTCNLARLSSLRNFAGNISNPLFGKVPRNQAIVKLLYRSVNTSFLAAKDPQ